MAFGDLARQDDYGIDPLTGMPFAPSPQAQGKFGRIADAVVGGLRNWVETPGRALRGETTPEEAYQWGPATAFGMIAGSKLPGGAVGSGMTKLPGIKAYHGSPHDFDRFDLSKIGTGEGAQAYGHGLYFAENEGVARGYRDALKSKAAIPQNAAMTDPQRIAGELFDSYRGQDLKSALDDARFYENAPLISAELRKLYASPPQGRMYEVNLNADPKQFLDWDRPLKEQPIAETVRSLVPSDLRKTFDYNVEKGAVSGANVYHNYVPNQSFVVRKSASEPYQPTGAKSMEEALQLAGGNPNLVRIINNPSRDIGSQKLAEAGIPGIRYLDQGSRTAGEGSRNYVVFDPGIIDILRKYGLAGAGATGFGTLAAQDNYRQ